MRELVEESRFRVSETERLQMDDQTPRWFEPPTFVIEPRRSLFDLDLGSIWHRRELLYFLVWRDVKVRYKQTASAPPGPSSARCWP